MRLCARHGVQIGGEQAVVQVLPGPWQREPGTEEVRALVRITEPSLARVVGR